jgi:ectoine hydroxylase-related dioxygenase (phytanoyl-CoA dioxygenase family)
MAKRANAAAETETQTEEKKIGLPFYSPPPGVAPLPYGKPGEMTDAERYLFETTGLLIVPDALSPEETAACQAASERLHSNLEFVQKQNVMQAGGEPPKSIAEWQGGGLQQLDNAWEPEPAFEALIDHPSVIEKVRALFGDTFILHSSWNTMLPGTDATGVHPDPNPKTGFHQDGTGSYGFNMMGNNNGLGGTGGPTPLVQLRIGFVMTDLSEPGVGQLAVIPGSHNAKMSLPAAFSEDPSLMSIAVEVNAKPGTAILFHQGVYHTSTPNYQPHNRYIQHMIYSGPWLVRSGRTGSDPEFLERTTERRRLLMGDFESGSYKRFHGPGPIPKL